MLLRSRRPKRVGVIQIQIVTRISREDMNMVMPYVLIAGRLVMLPDRRAIAAIGFLQRRGCELRQVKHSVTDPRGHVV